MLPEIAEQLKSINRTFYRQFSDSFSESRINPQPGFFKLLECLPGPKNNVLDVGCGNGRFGRFLEDYDALAAYTGVDFNQDFLEKAQACLKGEYQLHDISRRGWAHQLNKYDLIACFAVLQHIPQHQSRQALLEELVSHLGPGGRIFLSTWQFLDSPRQQRKIIPWEQIGLSAADVEPNDYLVSWDRGGFGMRYVNHIGIIILEEMAQKEDLKVVDHFRSDGKEKNQNLYTVLARL